MTSVWTPCDRSVVCYIQWNRNRRRSSQVLVMAVLVRLTQVMAVLFTPSSRDSGIPRRTDHGGQSWAAPRFFWRGHQTHLYVQMTPQLRQGTSLSRLECLEFVPVPGLLSKMVFVPAVGSIAICLWLWKHLLLRWLRLLWGLLLLLRLAGFPLWTGGPLTQLCMVSMNLCHTWRVWVRPVRNHIWLQTQDTN